MHKRGVNGKRKILFVSHEHSIGGSSVSLKSLIIGLKKCFPNDIEIIVLLPLSLRRGNIAKVYFETDGITCKEMLYRTNYRFRYKKKFFMNWICDFLNFCSVVPMSFYIKKNHFDVVCSNSTAVDVGARAAKLVDVPHIYYAREMMDIGLNAEYRNPKRIKNLFETSKTLIFISKEVEGYYKDRYRLKQTAQFYDGFIFQDYFVENHEILSDDMVSLVQVGALCDGKGTLNTIQMLNKLNERGTKNWKLEFVGDGDKDYRDKMEEMITKYHLESQITIGGFCENMKEKLSNKDLLIMNSYAEGFGRVTVEGMLAGCLVVGRYAGGTKEILYNDVNGLVFETEDQFLDILKCMGEHREQYRELAKRGQLYAVEQFDCTNTARQFMEVIGNI